MCTICESTSLMLWASLMRKNQNFLTGIGKKGAIMNKGTRNRLERELRNTVNHLDQAKAKQKQPIPQPGTDNIIRRRKGEKDKRFSVSIEPGLSITATG